MKSILCMFICAALFTPLCPSAISAETPPSQIKSMPSFPIDAKREIVFIKELAAKTNEIHFKDGRSIKTLSNINKLVFREQGQPEEIIWTDGGNLASIDMRAVTDVAYTPTKCSFLLHDFPSIRMIICERSDGGIWKVKARALIPGNESQETAKGFQRIKRRNFNSFVIEYSKAPNEVVTLLDNGSIERSQEGQE